MKKTILATALVLTGASAYADTKIAIVNPSQIFNDANSGSLSVKKLENDLKPEAVKLQQEQQTIMQEMQDLQSNSATMTKSVLAEKQQKNTTRTAVIPRESSSIAEKRI